MDTSNTEVVQAPAVPRAVWGLSLNSVVLTALVLLSSGCALPGSKGTQVLISGQLLDATGKAQGGQAIEITLPAEYGMSEIDQEHGTAEEFGRVSQRRTTVTDLLGSFSARFDPVEYSTAWWLIPPLGRFPRLPPEPMILIRVLDHPATWYQVLLKEEGIIYTILASNAAGFVPARKSVLQRRISGKPRLEERGDLKVWVSDLVIRAQPGVSREIISE